MTPGRRTRYDTATMRKPKTGSDYAPDWREAFALEYAKDFNFAGAARKVGRSRTACWDLYRENEDFRRMVDEAKAAALDALESAAFKRRSDRNTEFLLKAHRPDVYDRARQLQLTGADGGPVQFEMADVLKAKLDELAGPDTEDEEAGP